MLSLTSFARHAIGRVGQPAMLARQRHLGNTYGLLVVRLTLSRLYNMAPSITSITDKLGVEGTACQGSRYPSSVHPVSRF